MLCHGRTGLTEAVVTDPRKAVLFYGRQSLGESLSLCEVRDTAFTLTRVGTCTGKLAHLAANPFTLPEGWWVITQTITECWIEARGTGHPHSHPMTPQPFRFYCSDESLRTEHIEDAGINHQPSLGRPQRGRVWDWHWRDLRPIWPQLPSPLPDHGFESNRSSMSTALSVSSHLDRSEGSSIPNMADDAGRLETTWKSIYPSLKMRIWRMPSLVRVGDGTWLYIIIWGAGTTPSYHTPSSLCKGTLEN